MNLLKTLLFTVLVPGSVTIILPYLLLNSRLPPLTINLGPARFLGWGPIVSGAIIYLWCAWDFAAAGQGTPLPADPPKMLVAAGLYRRVRNPMYMGVLQLILGQAILFGSLLLLGYGALLWLAFHLFIIYYEEPTLKRLFGPAYEQYRAEVPRWLPQLKLK
ncbi:MAG TPA: isoprenylcysteine carboxylmethyltransferase family protein [Anaerolineae bacterium]|nr:isoprenylcysteine carboxylmethyltransferase family protein [Anaerolineae bacterium]